MKKLITEGRKCICPYCSHDWEPRVRIPVSCPKCKRYFSEELPRPEVIVQESGHIMFDWRKIQPLPSEKVRNEIEQQIREELKQNGKEKETVG